MTHSAHVKSLSCWALYGTESTGRNRKGQVDTHAGSRKSDEALAAAAAPVFSHPARKGRRLIGPEGVGLCCCFALARNLITDDERIPEQRRDVVRRRLAAKNVAVTVGASHGVVGSVVWSGEVLDWGWPCWYWLDVDDGVVTSLRVTFLNGPVMVSLTERQSH
jgi:hypothetical protein